jgi:UDP-GlcNAc3NAcA epimerase
VVLVYGDTNSTLAGALVATKLHIPVAHVESGLRSHDRTMPEEINRVVTDHVSTLLLAPTELAVANLASEGISGASVVLSGDVMFDAALRAAERVKGQGPASTKPFLLVTVHRPASTDSPAALGSIVDAVAELHARGFDIIWPVHPRTTSKFDEYGLRKRLDGVTLCDPVGFLEMTRLTSSAALVLTDSGGLQKEAYFHGRPCVTLRTTTEWTELVDLGWNRLVPPTDSGAIVAAATAAVGTTGALATPYGDGNAAKRIADSLLTLG